MKRQSRFFRLISSLMVFSIILGSFAISYDVEASTPGFNANNTGTVANNYDLSSASFEFFKCVAHDGDCDDVGHTWESIGFATAGTAKSFSVDGNPLEGLEFSIEGLTVGFYMLSEVAPPTGFSSDSLYMYFIVDGTGNIILDDSSGSVYVPSDFEQANGVPLTVFNTLNTTDFEFSKVDATNNSVLLYGATYAVYQKTPTASSFSFIGNLSEVTANSGLYKLNDLPYADYYLEQLTAPAGYGLSTALYHFTVNAEGVLATNNNGGTWVADGSARMIASAKIEQSLTFTKVDADNNSTTLTGATFAVYQKLPTASSFTRIGNTTTAGAVHTMSNLVHGDYYLEEITPPTGYYADTSRYYFHMDGVGNITFNDGGGDGTMPLGNATSGYLIPSTLIRVSFTFTKIGVLPSAGWNPPSLSSYSSYVTFMLAYFEYIVAFITSP